MNDPLTFAGRFDEKRRLADQQRAVERMAKRIQGEINQQIANDAESTSPYAWEGMAERIAEETPGIEDWEYLWRTPIGAPPMIVLTKYEPAR